MGVSAPPQRITLKGARTDRTARQFSSPSATGRRSEPGRIARALRGPAPRCSTMRPSALSALRAGVQNLSEHCAGCAALAATRTAGLCRPMPAKDSGGSRLMPWSWRGTSSGRTDPRTLVGAAISAVPIPTSGPGPDFAGPADAAYGTPALGEASRTKFLIGCMARSAPPPRSLD